MWGNQTPMNIQWNAITTNTIPSKMSCFESRLFKCNSMWRQTVGAAMLRRIHSTSLCCSSRTEEGLQKGGEGGGLGGCSLAQLTWGQRRGYKLDRRPVHCKVSWENWRGQLGYMQIHGICLKLLLMDNLFINFFFTFVVVMGRRTATYLVKAAASSRIFRSILRWLKWIEFFIVTLYRSTTTF